MERLKAAENPEEECHQNARAIWESNDKRRLLCFRFWKPPDYLRTLWLAIKGFLSFRYHTRRWNYKYSTYTWMLHQWVWRPLPTLLVIMHNVTLPSYHRLALEFSTSGEITRRSSFACNSPFTPLWSHCNLTPFIVLCINATLTPLRCNFLTFRISLVIPVDNLQRWRMRTRKMRESLLRVLEPLPWHDVVLWAIPLPKPCMLNHTDRESKSEASQLRLIHPGTTPCGAVNLNEV